MLYWTRKHGSQRRSKSHPVEVEPNFGGQGGFPYMAFRANGIWHIIEPETIEDVRKLQSQAAILALNVKERKNG